MATVTVYGLGGYDPSMPNGNIVEQYDDGQPEPLDPSPDVQALAEALSALPAATLDALKQALGIGS
jgi:hypothetical protein